MNTKPYIILSWLAPLIQPQRDIKTLSIVIVVLLLTSCTSVPTPILPSPGPTSGVYLPSATMQPTGTPTIAVTLINTQAPTETPTPVMERTETPVPSPTFPDPRKLLSPGLYLVYWRQNTWYIQGLDGSPGIPLMPVESPNSLASLSPDGKRVAFVDANDQAAIYDLDTGELITYPTTMKLITRFAWSPDGQVLLYSGFPDGWPFWDAPMEIYIIPFDQGETRLLVGRGGEYDYGGSAPAWSPDGQWIAFVSGSQDNSDQLYLMEAGCIEDLATCSEKTRLVWDRIPWSSPK